MNQYWTYSIPGFAEPISSLLHLAGALAFAALAVSLVRKAARRGPDDGDSERLVRTTTVGVFAFSVVFLLTISGLYHMSAFGSDIRRALLQWDYAAIFVLIAGTFTPSCAILFRGWQRRLSLALIWLAAAAGIALKSIYMESIPFGVGVSLYLGMGWCGAVGAVELWRRYGPSFGEPLVLGGAIYTAGAAVHLAGRPEIVPGVISSHELFHFAVVLGIGFHWYFISQFADGRLPVLRAGVSDEDSAVVLSASAREVA